MTTWVCPTCGGTRLARVMDESSRKFSGYGVGRLVWVPCPTCSTVLALVEAVQFAKIEHHEYCDTFDLMIHGKPCNCGVEKLQAALAPFVAGRKP